jgi:hypothetical protein
MSWRPEKLRHLSRVTVRWLPTRGSQVLVQHGSVSLNTVTRDRCPDWEGAYHVDANRTPAMKTQVCSRIPLFSGCKGFRTL